MKRRQEFKKAGTASGRAGSVASGLVAGALALALGGCSELPMSYMETFGPSADPVTPLAWGLTILSALVTGIIAILLLAGIFRRRRHPWTPGSRRLAVRHSGAGMRWIYIGVGISSVALFGSAVWSLLVLSAVAGPTGEPAFTIRVIGHQWWWEANYIDPDDPSRTFVTANELHIPIGKPVRLELVTADVIHSFWIPKLVPKTDLIPGQVNSSWIEASEPGVYRGQCVEFCGKQHAHMNLYAVAQPVEAFQAWWDRQLQPAEPPLTPFAAEGKEVFRAYCSACHRVAGTEANGRIGPDLTHLMGRQTIASGTLPNNTGYLAGWVADTQSIKPGNRMPSMNNSLTGPQLRAVVNYLTTLR